MTVNWRPQPDDVRRVFDEQNPWHAGGGVPDALAYTVERPLGQRLWERLVRDEPRRFHLILGPRRVGKTTVMYQTVRHLLRNGYAPQDLWWLRLDHPLLMRERLGDLVEMALATRALAAERPMILFLDEVVYAQDWDLWLKTFYDDRWPVQVVATSSATAMLRDRRLESGVGRWQEHYLTPYLFAEYLDLLGGPRLLPAVGESLRETIGNLPRQLPDTRKVEAQRRDFIFIGGFPELLIGHSPTDDRSELLRSQQVLRGDAVERAIYKDIPQSFGVDHPMQLERLLYVLAGQITGVLAPRTICQGLDGLSQPTLDRYLSYLTEAFLVFTLPNFSGSELSVQKRGRKLYFVDGAIRNAALQRGLAPLDNPAELGALLENLVASTMHALSRHSGVRLHHWRDNKIEVDLIFDQPGGPLALEIASSADHRRSGLVAFMDRHPKFKGHCYVVAPGVRVTQPAETTSGIGTLPLDLLLLAAARQAEAAQLARLAA